jgi:hypothetical protein
MSNVALSEASIAFAALPPGVAAKPQSVGLVVSGSAPVTITASASGPDATAFAVQLIVQTKSILPNGGMETTALGATGAIPPTAGPSPAGGAYVEISLKAPPQPVPAALSATIVVSWTGGSVLLPVTGWVSEFTVEVSSPQPLQLVATEDVSVAVAEVPLA